MPKLLRSFVCGLLVVALMAMAAMHAAAQRDVSREPARRSREWVRDGVIYEIFTRNFSPQGNFNGVTAQLDRLKRLGVTILWLMPIHIAGEEKKKGSVGSPYAVRDYYSINPDYGTKDDLKRLVAEAHRRGLVAVSPVDHLQDVGRRHRGAGQFQHHPGAASRGRGGPAQRVLGRRPAVDR